MTRSPNAGCQLPPLFCDMFKATKSTPIFLVSARLLSQLLQPYSSERFPKAQSVHDVHEAALNHSRGTNWRLRSTPRTFLCAQVCGTKVSRASLRPETKRPLESMFWSPERMTYVHLTQLMFTY